MHIVFVIFFFLVGVCVRAFMSMNSTVYIGCFWCLIFYVENRKCKQGGEKRCRCSSYVHLFIGNKFVYLLILCRKRLKDNGNNCDNK